MLRVGQGVADITPPLGIELAGFHKPVGEERRIEAIRQASEVRALVIEAGGQRVAILSLDICAVSGAFAHAVQRGVESETGIPAAHVRVCATHTHSMPTFLPFRQWGAVSAPYMIGTVEKAVDAVRRAVTDLAEADPYIGSTKVSGGNFNRTTPTWKTQAEFTPESTDADRWLDTDLQALHFQRDAAKGNILWYHFCAHPVCYADETAGPDWCGMVADRIESAGVRPSFLQGHIGDVNPGDGDPWRGDAVKTANAITPALHHAASHGVSFRMDEIRVFSRTVTLPFDYDRLREELTFYSEHPEECTGGVWVDAPFAKAWYDAASQWPFDREALDVPVSVIRIGGLAFLFHPGELYSFYGIQLRKTAASEHLWCVGYCDDFAGYFPDPSAYDQQEYAAIVVPKILDLPPFRRDVGRDFTQQCQALLSSLA